MQENFDLIILDPPAFAKTKRDVARATRGYKEINLQAIRHLTPGGMLATFSCSNFIEEDLFLQDRAGRGARCRGGLAAFIQTGGRPRSSAWAWSSRRTLSQRMLIRRNI